MQSQISLDGWRPAKRTSSQQAIQRQLRTPEGQCSAPGGVCGGTGNGVAWLTENGGARPTSQP